MHENGAGLKQDPAAAGAWYRKAAHQGHAAAQCNLGALYEEGIGVDCDHELAAEWYTKAATLGHASAQFNLGSLFESGLGVVANASAAVRWFRLAADQGDHQAYATLVGMRHRGSWGVTPEALVEHASRQPDPAGGPALPREAAPGGGGGGLKRVAPETKGPPGSDESWSESGVSKRARRHT